MNVDKSGRGVDTASAPGPRFMFRKKGQFAWKTIVLLVTTLALIPILLYQNTLAAELYILYLVVVHIVGIGIFLYGVRREDIAPSRAGFWGRVAGLLFALGMLVFAEKGLRTEFGTQVFWWSLFAVWALHTAGLALLHVRGSREQGACPFWVRPQA